MIPRPPRSTPFPTRRSSDLQHRRHRRLADLAAPTGAVLGHQFGEGPDAAQAHDLEQLGPGHGEVVRSEEHTSELQSRLHLVCRLLLEKKKKKTKYIQNMKIQ